ncbi:SDR family NAD(P)-dependent oxidoreductase [Maritalea sp.]|uniref:SDR family NAD(P)-dependent oxidoreductase n=1 Tax=Maritalea sp. TaxID=2003361 RepID=UPI003EF30A3B
MNVLDQFKLTGKRALVTGASRGLGFQMAMALAQAGADVIITGRNAETLEKSRKELAQFGTKIDVVAVDMADPKTCEEAFEQLAAGQFGPIHILINNIGGRTGPQQTQDLTLEQWQEAIDLNLTSCFLGTKILGREMIKRAEGGRIINVASMNAYVSNRGIGGRSYETAKAAMVQFTKATAADWAPFGINVNAICPGLFMTDANVEWNKTKPEVIEQITNSTPMGRAGEPSELGPLAVYLASPASSYMTGAALVIDGGYTLW